MTLPLVQERWIGKLQEWSANIKPSGPIAEPDLVEKSLSLLYITTAVAVHDSPFNIYENHYERVLRSLFWKFFDEVRPCLYVPRAFVDVSLTHMFAINSSGIVLVNFRTSSMQYGGTIAIHLITLRDDYQGEERIFDARSESPLRIYSLVAEITDESEKPRPVFSDKRFQRTNGADAFYILLQWLYDTFVAKSIGVWLQQGLRLLDESVSRELKNMHVRGFFLHSLYDWPLSGRSIRQKTHLIIRDLTKQKNALERREWIIKYNTDIADLVVDARDQFLVEISAAVFPQVTFPASIYATSEDALSANWYYLFFKYFWENAFAGELQTRIANTRDAYVAFLERCEQDGESVVEALAGKPFYSEENGMKYREPVLLDGNKRFGNDYDTDDSGDGFLQEEYNN
jgi:hypothetical protein